MEKRELVDKIKSENEKFGTNDNFWSSTLRSY